jgi:predicted MFS family arabinose efflux permease
MPARGDVYSKRKVLVVTKIIEIVAMGLGMIAFFSTASSPCLLSCFSWASSRPFQPGKIRHLAGDAAGKDLTRGNGLLEMSTFMAIILGVRGGAIYEAWKNHLEWIGAALVSIAALGTVTSLGIAKVPPSGSSKRFSANPLTEIWLGTRQLYLDRPLWLTVMGISYFWFLGALLQMVLPIYGKEILSLGETRIALLFTFTAVGIGVGSLAAGKLSGDKIELGLVPLGAVGMGIFSLALLGARPYFLWTACALVCLGFAAGFFAVPLNALLQHRSEREAKGRLIATNNVFNTLGVLLASAILSALLQLFNLAADRIVLIMAMLTFAATTYAIYVLPDFLVRFVLWLLTHTIYRIRVVGEQNVPLHGPALLVSNHVSFVDARIGASLPASSFHAPSGILRHQVAHLVFA